MTTTAEQPGLLHARRSFLLRRLHSLTGVLPLGVFLIEHLWTNAAAMGGQLAFDDAVDEIQRMPALPAIEIFGIFLPLAFHGIYGVYIAAQAQPNPSRYAHGRNWAYLFQRISGVVVLLFLFWHLWEFRLQKWFYGMHAHSFFGVASAHLSASWGGVPWLGIAYLVGIAAATYHFANGLVGFCATWGLAITRRAQQRIAVFAGVLGCGLFFLGASTVIFFATGTRLLPIAPPDTLPVCPEPSASASAKVTVPLPAQSNRAAPPQH